MQERRKRFAMTGKPLTQVCIVRVNRITETIHSLKDKRADNDLQNTKQENRKLKIEQHDLYTESGD